MVLSRCPIGVIDSGVGGVSVLNALSRLLPEENYIYLSDSAHAPYGIRTDAEIREVALCNAEYLIFMGCKALVIACNTATAVAVSDIRLRFPHIPVVGIEPSVRPALAYARENGGDVLVLATEVTVNGERFRRLCSRCCEEIGGVYARDGDVRDEKLRLPHLYSLALRDTVGFVERGEISSVEHISYLKKRLSPYAERLFSAVVLGCTHFPFAAEGISEALGYSVSFFDGANGTAKRLACLLEENKLMHSAQGVGRGWIEWIDTGGVADVSRKLRLFRRKRLPY